MCNLCRVVYIAVTMISFYAVAAFAADKSLNPKAENTMVKILKLQKADEYGEADVQMDKAMALFPNYERIFCADRGNS